MALIRHRATKQGQVLEPKAPTARNGPNTGSLAPGVMRRVKKKKKEKKSLFDSDNN